MQRHSSLAFLGLVGTGLHTLHLEVDPDISEQDRELASVKIVSLPKLITLLLHNLQIHPRVQGTCGERLRGLKQLALINCKETPLLLFRTTAMTSLAGLYLEDELIKDNNAIGIAMARLKADIEVAGKTILSLPNLVNIRGDSSIMEVGMKGLLTRGGRPLMRKA